MEFWSYRLHKILLYYVPPVLLVLGTIGNILSVYVLTRRSMRKHSTYFYLAILSTADTCVLLVGLLRLWIGQITGYDIKNEHDWACKLIHVLGHTLSDYSGWLIVAVTAERYVAVCHPLKATNICSRTRATRVVMLLLGVIFVLNLHFIWTVRLHLYSPDGSTMVIKCVAGDRYRHLVDIIWPWVDAAIYSFFPFLAIMTFNTLIIRQVVLAKRKRQRLQSGEDETSGPHSDFSYSCTGGSDGTRITIMLLTISFTFLLTTLPLNLSLIVRQFYLTEGEVPPTEKVLTLRLVQTITELLMYTNHAINFFLYCATGHKFRHQLVTSFRHKRTCVTKSLGLGGHGHRHASEHSVCLSCQRDNTFMLQRRSVTMPADPHLLSPEAACHALLPSPTRVQQNEPTNGNN